MTFKGNLYLDCDGVLANFDKAAYHLLGMSPGRYETLHGIHAFWDAINSDPKFFRNLELIHDGMVLYDAVKHLEPTILTGIPLGMDPLNNQKIEWSHEKFGRHQKIICCKASKKHLYIYEKGDILVDDRDRYRKKWLDKGGYFVHHTSSERSLEMLKFLGII